MYLDSTVLPVHHYESLRQNSPFPSYKISREIARFCYLSLTHCARLLARKSQTKRLIRESCAFYAMISQLVGNSRRNRIDRIVYVSIASAKTIFRFIYLHITSKEFVVLVKQNIKRKYTISKD